MKVFIGILCAFVVFGETFICYTLSNDKNKWCLTHFTLDRNALLEAIAVLIYRQSRIYAYVLHVGMLTPALV